MVTRRNSLGSSYEGFAMGLLSRIFGSLTPRGKAMSLYKDGIRKAEQRDLEGAIAAYSAVVEMSNAPGDVKAMALFNRSLAYSRTQDEEQAAKDLELVLAMEEATQQTKTAARERIKRMEFIRKRREQAS